MKISLIIPAYNEEKYIGACLEAAIKNSHGAFHEIIVVDNASTDKTAEIAGKFPGVKVVKESRKGLTRARQRGLKEATGDFLAYIDADTKMPEGWAEKAEKIFSKNSNIVSVSGPYRYYDSAFMNIIMRSIWAVSAPIMYRITGYMILGGNFIAKKDALLRAGGFNENVEFYGEDTDIAKTLSRQGKLVFRMDFYMPTSSRRLQAEGVIRTNIRYAVNFIWEVIFHRPYHTKDYKDIRHDN
ncbi:MAG: family 2 glycosyl transferase [Candidatus Giovannonibacteria bacterium GW2011_GWA2_44_13b]|uniref:Family 2 glycosyl transferase n=2 Tax=Candidatus Giovannoniibacteriota TaxID=1752738 RepID=A0A0G1H422_9BACT|nr:MAG: family 2 glycosyl transferase [Candidatus Giovannonibacteria bacterium GW2011_GWA2_44_13b]OGF81610.1 MAG: hypothetical protein A2924_02595 [Candidatus Giovannonibacteria bacterium RIFCSPLOWO2_01_FULL_44_16]